MTSPKSPKELIQQIRRIQIKTSHLVENLLVGAYHSAFKGQGIEIEEVRPYEPGDDMRAIDWNVTARMAHPFTKKFREERELTVLLVVDISASLSYSSQDKLKGELLAEIGALLAFSAIKNQDKVGLLLFSDQIESYLPPKKGISHVLRVIRDLLIFKPRGKGTNLKLALHTLNKLQKKRAICFVLSDFQDEGYKLPLALTTRRHDVIAINITDPLERTLPNVGLINMRDLETGEQRLLDTSSSKTRDFFKKQQEEREKRLKSLLKSSGADLIQLSTDKDYVEPIRFFFKKRSRRR